MATKKKAKKKRWYLCIYRVLHGDSLEVGAYAYGTRKEALFHLSSKDTLVKVISFTI